MLYNLQYRDLETLTTTTVTGITDLFYDLTGLTAASDYEFRVQEDDGTTVSAFSAWSGFTTLATAWPFFVPTTVAAKTWQWSGRHPKTGMRVRIFVETP